MDTKKALVTIIRDGLEIPLEPVPTGYASTTSTMVDSGTSVSGKLLGTVVRERVAQISLSWGYLTKDEWTGINRLFTTESESGGRFINLIRFFDQTEGDWKEREMYVSDRSAGIYRYDSNGQEVGWIDCSLELMEV